MLGQSNNHEIPILESQEIRVIHYGKNTPKTWPESLK